MADLIIEDKLIVELKCVDQFANEHLAQCINYLKASGMKLALLINFQKPRVEWKRVVYSSQICVYSRSFAAIIVLCAVCVRA